MSDNSFEARNAKAKTTRKPPRPIRHSRMQFEALEARNLMAADAAEASSEVLQASQMSAFFQQSALYENNQPATFPTVSWLAHLERPHVEPRRSDSIELIDRTDALIDSELREGSRRFGGMLPPGAGARASGGLRRLIRVDPGWPAQVYAPYVDMSATPMFDFVESAVNEGILYYNLAFISADPENRPSWGGDPARGTSGGAFDAQLRERIHELRALGGDVAVSFGGPQGTSLAEAIENVDELKQAYRNVVDAYGLSRIDFDLSGGLLDNQQAIERNWQAVAELQREMAELGAPLEVWVTVPATSKGLGDAALEAVRSAGQNGVNLDGVNLKTEYQETPGPQAQRRAGRETIESTINAYYQLRRTLVPDVQTGEVWIKIGITPVLGPQGDASATFGPNDAHELYGFAQQQRVGMVSVWSLNRDQQASTPPVERTPDGAAATESGGFDISKIFSDFGKLLPQ
ncbi:MAG: hypothetical protein WD845_12670 [Pirellulales bacterium]